MTAPFASSTAHLRAELARLDVLLSLRAQQMQPTAPGGDTVLAWLQRPFCAPAWSAHPLDPQQAQQAQTRLDEMAASIAARKAVTPAPLRLDVLANEFSLSPLATDLLLIALAPATDLRYGRIYAALQQTNQQYPTLNLALDLLLPDPAAKLAATAELSAAAPLRRHHLLALQSDPNWPDAPLLARALRPDSRIVHYLLDGNQRDERLLAVTQLVQPEIALAALHLPSPLRAALQQVADWTPPLLVYLHGRSGAGKRTAAAALCHDTQQTLLVVNGRSLATHSLADFTQLARLAAREARLQNAALYWDNLDELRQQPAHYEALMTLLRQRPGLTFLAGSHPWELPVGDFAAPVLTVDFAPPDYRTRRHLWETMLGDYRNGADVTAVAGQFRFTPNQIHHASAAAINLARRRHPHNPAVETADLFTASRRQSGRQLAQLAQRVPLCHTWDDLVLPPTPRAQLRELCQQAQYRAQVMNGWGFAQKMALGKGLTALFSGPPGTGKTMAAGVIAAELGLDLYKIDLSTVVSKYIGETEKNLADIFAAAAASSAILFFDEADALFGKRTEVRDAHDRYANIETGYLLQQIEAFEGMVILASNLRKNMDEAFTRRMQVIVEFPFPSATERRRIWQGIWPAATPRRADIDLEYLAEQVDVSGGHIRNIALTAAFLAAAEGGAVSMTHLVRATQREYEKIGRLVKPGTFGPYQHLVAREETAV